MSVHPHLPVVLSSDGYLVTVMQLPSLASYHGIMTSFMRDITRYVQVQVTFLWSNSDEIHCRKKSLKIFRL